MKILIAMIRSFFPSRKLVPKKIEIIEKDGNFYIKSKNKYLDDYRIKTNHYFNLWWDEDSKKQGKFKTFDDAKRRLDHYIENFVEKSSDNKKETVVYSTCIS